MQILDFITEVIATLIESIVYTLFLHIYMEYKGKDRYIIASGMTTLFFILGFFLRDYIIIRIVIYPAVLILYSVVFLKGTIRQAVAISAFMMVDTIIVNVLTILVAGLAFNIQGRQALIITGPTRMVLLGINRVFFVITFYTALRFVIKKRILTKEEWVIIALYFLADMVVATALIMWTATHDFSWQDYVAAFLIMFSIILITLISLVTINQISLKNEYSKQNELVNLKLRAQRREIMQLNEEYDNIRKIRHDMVKHLNIYMRLLNDGNYDAVKTAIGLHIEDCGKNRYVYIMQNDLINAVINEKANLCKDKEIEFDIKISAVSQESHELDIAVMLSNLLDNAVEAQEKLDKESKKYISLNIFSYQNKYCIIVKNTIFLSVLYNNPRLFTDKEDTYLHGMGMKSIEDTVEKYNGYIERYEENDMFCVHIMI